MMGARIVASHRLTDGFLRVMRYEIDVDRHDGGRHTVTREVNEFRPGLLVAGDAPFSDNLCAGGIAPGESVVDAATREMKEETGLSLEQPVVVHPGAYVSSGGTSEKIAIVVGRVDTSAAGGLCGNPEESEDIRVVVLAADAFIARVRAGDITDLKTLVAGYWLAEHRAGLRRSASR